MKVLVISNGAREHCIAATLARSPQQPEIIVFADKKNPGLMALASKYEIADSVCNLDALRKFVETEKPDLAIIGPEAPITAGAGDLLEEMGVGCLAPRQKPGQLESSKSFTRDLLQKYEIPGNPAFAVFKKDAGSEEEMRDAIRDFMEALRGEFVVKADGLCGGKGVKVTGDHLAGIDDGLHYAMRCLLEDGSVVVEEKLIGEEFSAMFLADGETIAALPIAQDHKRAFENDRGPNTGGMGSYSDADGGLPFVTEEDREQAKEITQAVMEAIEKETGEKFRGVMYGGFIATANGTKLIEYNARFGDPEAMNVLPVLKTDFVEVCRAVATGNLKNCPLEFENKATVVKYVVPDGYPDEPKKGDVIQLFGLPEGCEVFYGSVDLNDAGELTLGGSRTLAFVGKADTLEEAERIAEAGTEKVEGPLFHRRDIGTPALVAKRVANMKNLRG